MQFRIVGMRVVVILGRIFFLVSFGLEYIGRDGPPRAGDLPFFSLAFDGFRFLRAIRVRLWRPASPWVAFP